MKQTNFSTVPELRAYQNTIYGVIRKVPGLEHAGLMWAPLRGQLVRIRKAETSPETYLVLFEVADTGYDFKTASPAETIQVRQEAIRSQGMNLGLAGLGLIAGAIGVAAAAGSAPFIIALAGAGAAAYGVGIGVGKLELALKGDMHLYESTLDSQDLKNKEFWSDVLGLTSGLGSAAIALKGIKGLTAVKPTIDALAKVNTSAEKATILNRLSAAEKNHLIDFLEDMKKGHVLKHALPAKAGMTGEQRIDKIIKGINWAHGGTGAQRLGVRLIPAQELVRVMQKAIRGEQVFQRVAFGAGVTTSNMNGAVGEIMGKLTSPYGQIEVKLPASYCAGLESGNNLAIATRGPKGETSVKIVGWTIFQKPVPH